MNADVFRLLVMMEERCSENAGCTASRKKNPITAHHIVLCQIGVSVHSGTLLNMFCE